MTYSLHGSSASSLHVQHGTDEQIADSIGGDPTDSLEQRIVLNDMGNQHALVIEGTTEDFRLLADEIRAVADKIDGFTP